MSWRVRAISLALLGWTVMRAESPFNPSNPGLTTAMPPVKRRVSKSNLRRVPLAPFAPGPRPRAGPPGRDRGGRRGGVFRVDHHQVLAADQGHRLAGPGPDHVAAGIDRQGLAAQGVAAGIGGEEFGKSGDRP